MVKLKPSRRPLSQPWPAATRTRTLTFISNDTVSTGLQLPLSTPTSTLMGQSTTASRPGNSTSPRLRPKLSFRRWNRLRPSMPTRLYDDGLYRRYRRLCPMWRSGQRQIPAASPSSSTSRCLVAYPTTRLRRTWRAPCGGYVSLGDYPVFRWLRGRLDHRRRRTRLHQPTRVDSDGRS